MSPPRRDEYSHLYDPIGCEPRTIICSGYSCMRIAHLCNKHRGFGMQHRRFGRFSSAVRRSNIKGAMARRWRSTATPFRSRSRWTCAGSRCSTRRTPGTLASPMCRGCISGAQWIFITITGSEDTSRADHVSVSSPAPFMVGASRRRSPYEACSTSRRRFSKYCSSKARAPLSSSLRLAQKSGSPRPA